MRSSWEDAQIHSLGSSSSFSHTTSRTSSSDSRHRTLMSSQSPARNRLFKAQANWLHFKITGLLGTWFSPFLYYKQHWTLERTTLCYRADVTNFLDTMEPCVTQTFCLLPPSPIFDFCRNTRNYRGSSTYKVLTNDFACYSRESVNISTMETRGENFLKIALVITSHHNRDSLPPSLWLRANFLSIQK